MGHISLKEIKRKYQKERDIRDIRNMAPISIKERDKTNIGLIKGIKEIWALLKK
jgi:hypothetical protein